MVIVGVLGRVISTLRGTIVNLLVFGFGGPPRGNSRFLRTAGVLLELWVATQQVSRSNAAPTPRPQAPPNRSVGYVL